MSYALWIHMVMPSASLTRTLLVYYGYVQVVLR